MAAIEVTCPSNHQCEALRLVNRQIETLASSVDEHNFADFDGNAASQADSNADLLIGRFTTGFHAAVAVTERIQSSLDSSGPCVGEQRCNLAFLALREYSGKGLLLDRKNGPGVTKSVEYTPVNISGLFKTSREESR